MMVLEFPMYNHIESRRFDRIMVLESPMYNHIESWRFDRMMGEAVGS